MQIHGPAPIVHLGDLCDRGVLHDYPLDHAIETLTHELTVAMIIYAERKIWAAMALRRGPNVVGPFGLLQSFADGLKVFLKETIIPTSANKGLFLIAPIIP